jgi:ferredoxin-thioredoxin reductase catalytic chain
VSGADALALLERLDREAERSGYHLNPDRKFTLGLMEGLLANEARYGYQACPCRLASGVREEDLDIVCPCDYRDPDLSDFGTCYCALYVSRDVQMGRKRLGRIRDRRPPDRTPAPASTPASTPAPAPAPAPAGAAPQGSLAYPVWRCRVCGYLCARGEPPESCPICHATKERFERFL